MENTVLHSSTLAGVIKAEREHNCLVLTSEFERARLPPISAENPVAPLAITHTLFSLRQCSRVVNHAKRIHQT